MVLKRLKLQQFFNGVAQTFSYTQGWVSEGGRNLKISAKNAAFLISSGKNQISPLLAPRRKTFGKKHYRPPRKNSFRRPCTQTCKMTLFLWKNVLYSLSGNAVQQHQCGEQSIAGWQTVHRVICQIIAISCQVTNDMLEENIDKMLPKFCNVFLVNDSLYHWTQY